MTGIADALLAWHAQAGRKDLPWQQAPTPYRVWISEIMLQQTQVGTVIPYFLRFMERFPSVVALAQASLDEVLHYWAGLGYYARARNLHRAAGQIVRHHGGELPADPAQLHTLPGVGRSTAGAILALSRGQRHPILDGNVKRVLSRYHAVEGWPGSPAVERELWTLAELHTPWTEVARYTQAIMDLGATVCARGAPDCVACPLRSGCAAHAQGRQRELPAPRPRAALRVRRTTVLLIQSRSGEVLLERRPPAGVWGGLWSLPECPDGEDPQAWCLRRFRVQTGKGEPWPTLRHTFTHFHLDIEPLHLHVTAAHAGVLDADSTLWYNLAHPQTLGLAAPIQRLLARARS